jgi:membrane fusion protein, multidrug efflux system
MKPVITWVGLSALAVAVAMVAGFRASAPPTPAAPATAERPAVAVDVEPVGTADFTDAIEVTGSLAPKVAADVKSEVSGTVTAVYVTEWLPVRKGAPLARLDTREIEAAIDALRAARAQAQVAETRARREQERALQLQEYGLITPQHLDDAKSALEAATAATGAADAQIKASEARLRKSFIAAPIDGVVALRTVKAGDRVENIGSGEPLFRIVNTTVLSLTVTVPSSQLGDVRVGQPLEFTTDSRPGQTFTGRVMFINPVVDEVSRSAKVVADVPNRGDLLKGGLFVKGRIVTAARPGVLQVAADALQDWNVAARTANVFVVRDGKAQKTAVRTGAVNGRDVEIVAGLSAGADVVTRGAFALRPGDRVRVARVR